MDTLPSLGHELGAVLAGWGLPAEPAFILAMAILSGVPLFGIVLPMAAVGQIVERKLAAAMQRRIGPNTAGLEGPVRLAVGLVLWWMPRERRLAIAARLLSRPPLRQLSALLRHSGLGQLLADGVKMLGKQDLEPAGADRPVFRMAPYIAMAAALLGFVAIPFGQHLVMLELSVGTVYLAATSGLVVMSLFMAGWGSNNKWSLLGGMRAVAQVVSYEVPVGLVLAGIVLWSGTMNLQQVVAQQYHPGVLSLAGWNLFAHPCMPLLAGVYLAAGLAECQRTPFDMAEAESELVSGFNVEYSGLRWGMFALAEYAEVILVGCIFTTCFLGGYQSPIGEEWIATLPPLAEAAVHAVILAAKAAVILVLAVWIRWTLPRIRVDRVMQLAWMRFVPLALLGLLGLAATLALLGGGTPAPRQTYGRLTVQPGLAYTTLEWLLVWLALGAATAVLVWWARRQRPALHPALQRLTSSREQRRGLTS
jgi:NADH-quinone oxidoreductase subunit H